MGPLVQSAMVLPSWLDAIAILATAMVAGLVTLRSCRNIRHGALLREREALLGVGDSGAQ